MSFPSFADVLCPDFPLTGGCSGHPARGTLVRLGVNAGPIYEIVSIEGPTAWIREPITFRGEALVPLDRLRLAEPAPTRPAESDEARRPH